MGFAQVQGSFRGLWVAVLLAWPMGQSASAVIVNGDFSDPIPLAGFTATGAVIDEPTGEFAQLETDTSFIRTLSQTVGLPATASTLSFDFAFSTAGIPPPAGFADSLAVSLLTTLDGDFLDILVVDVTGAQPDPSDGFEGITGALPIDVALDPGVVVDGFVPLPGGGVSSGRISLPLPEAVLGEEATLFFDLFDELDGFTSIAALDNIEIAASAVPEPAPLRLALVALLAMAGARRIRRAGHGRPSP